MTEMDMYLWLKLDDIIGFLNHNPIDFFSIVGTGLSFIYLVAHFIDKTEKLVDRCSFFTTTRAVVVSIILFFSMSWLVLTSMAAKLIPTTKQYAVIKIVPAIYNSKAIQKDLPEVYEVAKEVLVKELKDIKVKDVAKEVVRDAVKK